MPHSDRWSSDQFAEHLQEELGAAEGAATYERIEADMLSTVGTAMRSVADVIEGRPASHELYGFDFMLDASYGVVRPGVKPVRSTSACTCKHTRKIA